MWLEVVCVCVCVCERERERERERGREREREREREGEYNVIIMHTCAHTCKLQGHHRHYYSKTTVQLTITIFTSIFTTRRQQFGLFGVMNDHGDTSTQQCPSQVYMGETAKTTEQKQQQSYNTLIL